MSSPLSSRALNRATLARQLLLERSPLDAERVIAHLVGMQGQAPLAPYVGLWTRMASFRPDELAGLLTSRRVVRGTLMRATVHLVTAGDFLGLRPLTQPVLVRAFSGQAFAKSLAGLDLDTVLDVTRALVEETPRSRGELSKLLAGSWPDRDAESLGYAATYLEPMVQVPPRAVWGVNGPAVWTTSRSWLGGPLSSSPSVEQLVLRYLGAFGPATVKDVQQWSGLTRLREVVDRLRPQLVELRGEHGAELWDLPDAPRPDPDAPAPPRFLPEYDNLLLSHADRSRVIVDQRRVPLPPGNGATGGTVLVDGMWTATWKIVRRGDEATLEIAPFVPLTPADQDALGAEATALLAFASPDHPTHAVRFT